MANLPHRATPGLYPLSKYGRPAVAVESPCSTGTNLKLVCLPLAAQLTIKSVQKKDVGERSVVKRFSPVQEPSTNLYGQVRECCRSYVADMLSVRRPHDEQNRTPTKPLASKSILAP